MQDEDLDFFLGDEHFSTDFTYGFLINIMKNNNISTKDYSWPGSLFMMLYAFWEGKTRPESYRLIDCARYCVENNLNEDNNFYKFLIGIPQMRPEYLKNMSSISDIPASSYKAWDYILRQLNRPELYIDIYTVMQEIGENLSVFDNLFMMDYNGWTFSMKINFQLGKITLIQASFYTENKIKNFSYNYTFTSNSHFRSGLDLFDTKVVDSHWFDIIGH